MSFCKRVRDDEVYLLEAFEKAIEHAVFTSYDGSGYYGYEDGHFGSRPIDWKNLKEQAMGCTHVYWYNK